MRVGKNHCLNELQLSHDLVKDNSSILGNSKQLGNDSGLHAMILPILLQDQLFLQVFGNTEKEKTLFSIEIRRRVILSVYFRKLFFEPDDKRSWSKRRNLEEVQ